MALPASWVDHLFAKLAVRYGAAFMRQWPDTDPVLVKADWAEVLDGTKGESITYALANLPDKPPHVLAFRDLCRRAPSPAALPAPVEPADPQRVKAALERMQSPVVKRASLAQECIDGIAKRVDSRISPAQKHMILHCLQMPGTRLPESLKRIPKLTLDAARAGDDVDTAAVDAALVAGGDLDRMRADPRFGTWAAGVEA